MQTVTLKNANQNLESLVNQTINNCEEIVISSDSGVVIMIDEREYNSMQETLRLLKDKKSLKTLLESHQARDEKKEIKSISIDEAFGDFK